MPTQPAWPIAGVIETARLTLEPLRPEHAVEMAPLLDDADLHRYIGGHPGTPDELRVRYTRQSVGHAPDGQEGWLNWIVRHRAAATAVGTVQATLSRDDGRTTAEVAWVTGTGHQHNGYATEAAAGMVGWLRQHGAGLLTAHIHPDHHASRRVAGRLGLTPTALLVDGETRWISDPPPG